MNGRWCFAAALLCMLGLIANAWLGCALPAQWAPACAVQGAVLVVCAVAFSVLAVGIAIENADKAACKPSEYDGP